MRLLRLFPLAGLAAAVALLPADDARGCAIAPRDGQRVGVAAESAVIVWDETAKSEHFVRRASFSTTSTDFGFLVPTPSLPELAEAGDGVFTNLEGLTAPRVEVRTEHVPAEGGGVGCFGAPGSKKPDFSRVGEKMAAAPPPKVAVLNQQKVGRYDAVSLKADDPNALREWLEKHGYAARPELTEWLKAYTGKKWVLTAFKIGGQTGEPPAAPKTVDATAVRMTFKTDTPFYPYREPADMRAADAAGGRLLRVYFFGPKRYAGTLGKDGAWPGRPVWANAAGVPTFEGMKVSADAGWWLTEFEDRSSPRPGTDEVYFAPDADQSPKERPPVIHVNYVYDEPAAGWPVWVQVVAGTLPVLMVVALYLLWRRLARRV